MGRVKSGYLFDRWVEFAHGRATSDALNVHPRQHTGGRPAPTANSALRDATERSDHDFLVNPRRRAVVDSRALLDALPSRHLGGAALDVQEEEADLFFRDLSDQVLGDDVFARLLTFPNVLVTAHQGFLTTEALAAIARTTAVNLHSFETGAVDPPNRMTGAAVPYRLEPEPGRARWSWALRRMPASGRGAHRASRSIGSERGLVASS